MAEYRTVSFLNSSRWLVKGRLRTLGILCVIVLVGCVPASVTYYQPSAEGGVLVKPRCATFESMLDLFAHEVRLRARVDNMKGIQSIGVMVQPPQSGTVRFATADFALRDSVSHRAIPIRSVEASGSKPVTVPVTSMLYVTVAAENLESHPAFELQLPAIVINGSATWQSPVIRFQRKTWTGIEVLCGP